VEEPLLEVTNQLTHRGLVTLVEALNPSAQASGITRFFHDRHPFLQSNRRTEL
jgi:hypothetical protein